MSVKFLSPHPCASLRTPVVSPMMMDRLITVVAFYDRVLGMGKGEVVEYDAPAALLRK